MNNDDLVFVEVKDEEDITLENSSGCKTNGTASGCCTTYCTDSKWCGCENKESSNWNEFLEGNAGIIQY